MARRQEAPEAPDLDEEDTPAEVEADFDAVSPSQQGADGFLVGGDRIEVTLVTV
jgi:hypothetical protein